MRINLRKGAAVGILAAALTTLGPLTAHASVTPGTVTPVAASHAGLPAQQGAVQRDGYRCYYGYYRCYGYGYRYGGYYRNGYYGHRYYGGYYGHRYGGYYGHRYGGYYGHRSYR